MTQRSTVQEALAAFLKHHRQQQGMSQAAYAVWLNQRGVPWTRATVGAVEARRRDIGLDEALWLALLVRVPLDEILERGRLLLRPASRAYLAGVEYSVQWNMLEHVARYGRPGAWTIAAPTRSVTSDAEYDARLAAAATRLRRSREGSRRRAVSTAEVQTAAEALWGHPAAWERDRRLRETPKASTGSSARAVIGHRAHTTRAMVQEIVDHLRRNADG